MDLRTRVKEYMLRHRMVAPGMRVLVGVSGGPDSVALLDVLCGLREELGISLAVAHLNHRLRGEAAEADARYVRELASGYGLPCVAEEFDVAAYRKARRLSVEEAAREVRYRFLVRAAGETASDRVALGHQADDQAETILHHFLRGAGPAGLAGMAPVRAPYIRPLLAVRRRDIETYCRARGLEPRRDVSNLDPAYTRNRLRHSLLPLLEREYNPNLVGNLLRLGEICREEDTYLDELAGENFARLAERENDAVAVDAAKVAALPRAIARRVVRRAWAELAGEARILGFEHVERVLALARRAAGGGRLELSRDFVVERQAGRLWFRRAAEPARTRPWCYEVAVPGRTRLPEVDQCLTAEIRPAGEVRPEVLASDRAVLDLESLELPLYVRNRRPGDVFAPQGVGGRMKLKEFLINCKVPRSERDRIPLVFDRAGRLVWVAGYRIAEFCKLGPESRTALVLALSRPAGGFELC